MPCNIISAARNITIMFRRLRNPTRPMPNSKAPTIRNRSSNWTSSMLAALLQGGRAGRRLALGDDGHGADQGDQQQRARHLDGDQVPAEKLSAEMGHVLRAQDFGVAIGG